MERYVDFLFVVMMTLMVVWGMGATGWVGYIIWHFFFPAGK